ncbi:conserved hypothetical protein [Histoplasma capsulatum G186AR]|uniref:F-box domain-containing protein n=2 Tax=Ajellomyces capsulatus TaxID=5037 RepID=C0NHX2_AJECG|nr:uncharacterized protein HCBG_02944 [Histoplasma capsulatum G186AR]EEH09407.1 conserved hypothetical protein [Histoplasma capsulatum G186AR]
MNRDTALPSRSTLPGSRPAISRGWTKHETGHPEPDRCSSCSLLDLPSELHLQLMSWLDFRDIQMLRATNSYFRHLPSDTQIARIRRDYVADLVSAEMKEVAESAANAASTPASNDTSSDDASQRLTCYSCLRHLLIHAFSRTQMTRRRGKGHADASKRFCVDCALRLHKWEPGISLSFSWGDAVYCRRCRGLVPLRNSPAEWAGTLGLCEGCQAVLGIPDWRQHEGEGTRGFWYEAKALLDRNFAEQRKGMQGERADMWETLRGEIASLRLSEKLEV